MKHPMPRLWHFFAFSFLLLTCGCAAGLPSGSWDVDDRVRQAFEAGHLFPDHTYYYLGSATAPDAIIAVDNRYTLQSRVWERVDISQEQLGRWMQFYRTDNSRPCDFWGGVIRTPDGQPAGFWYAQDLYNVVTMPAPGVLIIHQPTSPWGGKCGTSDGFRFFAR